MTPKKPSKPVELVRAETELSQEQLLDVGIVVFDAGVPDSLEVQEKELIFPDVRRAEARYIPYHLKTTLEETGHWGAVWELPKPANSVDVIVTGEIDKSDGLTASIKVVARDATGREWLDKRYKTNTGASAYSNYRITQDDAYQNMYNQIANDLLEVRNSLSTEELVRIRDVSELRYAAALVPDAFVGYLEANKNGDYELLRLPAENDTMMVRMRAVREREYMLLDTLNEYYAGLYYDLSQPYQDWRKASRDDSIRYAELRREAVMLQIISATAIIGAIAIGSNGEGNGALTDLAVIGGIEAFRSGMGKSAEAKLYQESLRELGSSFDSEAEPLVVEVEGQTLRLTGTAVEKYEEWQRLLNEIYAAETGFIVDPDTVDGSDEE